jgi:hypothetical protein
MSFSWSIFRSFACACFAGLGLLALWPGTAQAQFPSLPLPIATTPLPVLRVTLSQSIYRIHADPKTGRPEMPKNVVAAAELQNWPQGIPRPVDFAWRVYLDWDFAPSPTHHSIRNRLFTQPSPLNVDFGNEIRGGTLTVFARTDWNGQVVWGKARAQVLGENPPRAAVLRAFPPSRFGLIASKIGMAESGLRQFTSASAADPGGLPLVSRSNDLGIMQLNAPSGTITSDDQVWDWRANVTRGLQMLQGKRQTTVLASRHAVNLQRVPEVMIHPNYQTIACLNYARLLLGMPCLPAPSLPPLSDAPGSGMLPGEPDPDHVRLSQIEREAVRRYNGGREYAYVVTADPGTLDIQEAGWQVDPTRGGIRANAGDPNYVLHVLAAHSGFTIPPPHKPARVKHHARRRRHHK